MPLFLKASKACVPVAGLRNETYCAMASMWKAFIAVVSTCKLILEQLPATPKQMRKQKIDEFMSKARKTGALPPTNLQSFLEAERKKIK